MKQIITIKNFATNLRKRMKPTRLMGNVDIINSDDNIEYITITDGGTKLVLKLKELDEAIQKIKG